MDRRLLDVLVCPVCKAPLVYRKAEQEFVCTADRLAYPIRDGIPVMLPEEARAMEVDEKLHDSPGRTGES